MKPFSQGLENSSSSAQGDDSRKDMRQLWLLHGEVSLLRLLATYPGNQWIHMTGGPLWVWRDQGLGSISHSQ